MGRLPSATGGGGAGRKLVEIAQVARGRTPLKYELEVIPFFAGEVGSEQQQLAVKQQQMLAPHSVSLPPTC
jgi:hypothetical protein